MGELGGATTSSGLSYPRVRLPLLGEALAGLLVLLGSAGVLMGDQDHSRRESLREEFSWESSRLGGSPIASSCLEINVSFLRMIAC